MWCAVRKNRETCGNSRVGIQQRAQSSDPRAQSVPCSGAPRVYLREVDATRKDGDRGGERGHQRVFLHNRHHRSLRQSLHCLLALRSA